MRLIFLLQKEAWFVEHTDAWYRLHDLAHVELALGGLALKMVDQHDLIEQPHQAGTATLVQSDQKSIKVTLKTAAGVLIDTLVIVLDERSLINVNWITRKFRDGWVSADAEIMLDNVGAMFLEAYLPARKNSGGKTLTILNNQNGKVREIWMERDRKTRIPLLERGSKGRLHLNLQCEPEEVDQSSEPRQLGFVLVSEEPHPV